MNLKEFTEKYFEQFYMFEVDYNAGVISIIDEDEETEVSVPLVYEKCCNCNGSGSHTNPSIDGNGLSDDLAGDPEFMQDYMSGGYDVQCTECHGFLLVPTSKDPRFEKALDDYYDIENQMDAECEAERRMGA